MAGATLLAFPGPVLATRARAGLTRASAESEIAAGKVVVLDFRTVEVASNAALDEIARLPLGTYAVIGMNADIATEWGRILARRATSPRATRRRATRPAADLG